MTAPHPATAKGEGLTGVVEIALTTFALWTLYCNALVYSGQDFDALLGFCFVPLVASAVLLSLRSRFATLRLAGSEEADATGEACAPPLPETRGASLPVVLTLAAAATACHAAGLHLAYWLGAIGVLAYLCIAGVRSPTALSENQPPADGDRNRQLEVAGVLCIAALAAAVTLVSHRSDGDDSVYVSMIVHAMDFPSEALLRYDGIHGVKELPLTFTNYRAHSFELLSATIASLSGAEPLQVYYLWMPALMAIGVVIAHWLFLRQVAPRLALGALAFSMIVLIAWGDSYRSPGNLAFVRLFQGKAILATSMIPLILFFARRFAQRRDLRSWMGLCAAQISAVGLTATAVTIAPISAGLMLLACARLDAASLRMLLAGAVASLHSILIGVIVAYESSGATGLAVATHPDSFGILYQDIDVQRDLAAVFGVSARAWIALACLPIVPFFVSGRAQRRVIALLGLSFVAIVLNPWTSSWLIQLLAEQGSTLLTWRFLWILPLPLLVGLCAAGLCRSIATLGRSAWGYALCLAIAACVYVSLPGTRAVSSDNGVRFGVPGYKVGSGWKIAARMAELTPRRGRVLAPENVAQWLPTLREHPYPEVARILYLAALDGSLGRDEVATRIKLHRFISGKKGRPMPIAEAMALLQQRQIDTLAFADRLEAAAPLAQALRSAGWTGEVADGHQLWSRAR